MQPSIAGLKIEIVMQGHRLKTLQETAENCLLIYLYPLIKFYAKFQDDKCYVSGKMKFSGNKLSKSENVESLKFPIITQKITVCILPRFAP